MKPTFARGQVKQFLTSSLFMLTASAGMIVSQGVEINDRIAASESAKSKAALAMIQAEQGLKLAESYEKMSSQSVDVVGQK